MKNINQILKIIQVFNPQTTCSNIIQDQIQAYVNVDQSISLNETIKFNMTIQMFLNKLDVLKTKENIKLDLEQLGFIIKDDVNLIKLTSIQPMFSNQENNQTLVSLICNFQLGFQDKTFGSQQLIIPVDQFQLQTKLPKTINITIDQFYTELEQTANINKVLTKYKILVSENPDQLVIKPRSLAINKNQHLLSFEYLDYQNQDITIYLPYQINLNEIQFITPNQPVKLDTGSIIGISITCLSLFIILTCLITIIIKKKKKLSHQLNQNN